MIVIFLEPLSGYGASDDKTPYGVVNSQVSRVIYRSHYRFI